MIFNPVLCSTSLIGEKHFYSVVALSGLHQAKVPKGRPPLHKDDLNLDGVFKAERSVWMYGLSGQSGNF